MGMLLWYCACVSRGSDGPFNLDADNAHRIGTSLFCFGANGCACTT